MAQDGAGPMIELRVDAGEAAAVALTQVKLIAQRFPGEHELLIRTGVRGGTTLRLGPMWTYDASAACLAALEEFGSATLRVG